MWRVDMAKRVFAARRRRQTHAGVDERSCSLVMDVGAD